MNNRIAITALGVVLATAASAQQDTAAQQQQAAPPVAGTVTLGTTIEQTKAIALGYRVSKLIKATVYNDQDQKIGKVEDLIVQPDGTLSIAIVDVGGFLGMGRHRVAIPVGQFTSVKPKVVLPGATKDALKKLPEFQYAKG
jgi:sporulation protein YlmC with PRC-barrel domain